MEKKGNNPLLVQNNQMNKSKTSKKITITVDEDDPCLKKDKIPEDIKLARSADDPRFQQQNQTQRCFVMYTDFYRCEHILGKDAEACAWFKNVFTCICPKFWIERWDELRLTGRLPWHKYKTQGPFPGDKYGE